MYSFLALLFFPYVLRCVFKVIASAAKVEDITNKDEL